VVLAGRESSQQLLPCPHPYIPGYEAPYFPHATADVLGEKGYQRRSESVAALAALIIMKQIDSSIRGQK